MTAYLMDCGHLTTRYIVKDFRVIPVCDTCGVRGMDHVEREVRGSEFLDGRISRCVECGRAKDSEWDLPYFTHRPNQPNDTHFCGCRAWR